LLNLRKIVVKAARKCQHDLSLQVSCWSRRLKN